MRRYLLLPSLLTLLLAVFVFLAQSNNSPNTDVAAVTVASDSSFPVITPDNVDRLAPIVTLTRGGTNYNNNLRYPVWSPDGKWLAVVAGGSQDNPLGIEVRLYATNAPEEPPRQFEHYGLFLDMVFSPNGNSLAAMSDTGFEGGKVVVWNTATGEQELVIDEQPVYAMHFNRDGTRFVVDDFNNVWIWDIVTGQEISSYPVVHHPEFNRDVTMFATIECDWTCVITLVDVDTGQQVLMGEQSSLIATTFSPDDRLLAAWSNDNIIQLWGLVDGEGDLLFEVDKYDDIFMTDVMFSPNGALLASWNNRGNVIHLWSVTTGNHMASLEGHRVPGSAAPGGSTLDVTFSPDGALIASFWQDYSDTEDDNLRLWDVASGELLRTIPDEFSATFSPDGTMLATDSGDGSVKIWAVSG